jgi:LysR family hydrogen peroxide-inducible transcriptional activator
MIKRLGSVCPRAVVEVFEEVTRSAIARCLDGEVDVIILAGPLENPALHVEHLFRDELLLALPARHILAKKQRVTLSDLASEPFILLDEAHCLTSDVLAFCHQRDFQPRVTCRSSQLYTVQRLVALRQGISLIPRIAVEAAPEKGCVYRPVAGQPARSLVLAWNRNRFQSPIVKQLIGTIREVAAEQAVRAKN